MDASEGFQLGVRMPGNTSDKEFEVKRNDIMLHIRDEYLSPQHFMENLDQICERTARSMQAKYHKENLEDGTVKVIFDF